MKLRYIALLGATLLLACGSCRKEANELAHHHDHGHEHAHEGHDEHEDHDEHGHEGHNHEHSHQHNHNHNHDHNHDHEGHSHGEAEKAEAHGDEITLKPEVAKQFGLKTEVVKAMPFGSAVKAAGVVSASAEGSAVASAPTAGIVTLARGINQGSEVKAGTLIATVSADKVSGGDANRAALAELDAAKAEYDRVNGLYADRLVTLAQLNAAKAAYERAKASYSAPAANGRITAPISGVITSIDIPNGSYAAVGQPVATIASSATLTLRADVPFADYQRVKASTDARISAPYLAAPVTISSLGGRRASSGSVTAAAGGFVPVVFTLRNDGTLLPGSAVEVWLLTDASRQVLTVPRSALSEQQGTFFVYEQLDEDCYRRLPVAIGASDGDRVEIVSGLKGGENIVTEGVTAVRLAAASGAVPAGHSHSH